MILWLSENTLSAKMRAVVGRSLQQAGCRDFRMLSIVLSNYIPSIITQSGKGKKNFPSPEVQQLARRAVAELAQRSRATLVICQDFYALRALTGEPLSLAKACGSLYWLEDVKGKKYPMIGMMDPKFQFQGGDNAYLVKKTFEKISRWANGEQRAVPAFQFTLCKTLDDVRTFVDVAKRSLFIAEDIETTGRTISCLGATMLMPDGSTQTFCAPLVDKRRDDNGHRYWSREAERTVHSLLH